MTRIAVQAVRVIQILDRAAARCTNLRSGWQAEVEGVCLLSVMRIRSVVALRDLVSRTTGPGKPN